MAVLQSEYKEWFNTKAGFPLMPYKPEDSGLSDQDDPAAAKNKLVNGVSIGTIFNANDEPSQANYQKLFQSVTFKLNAADRAAEQPPSFTAYSNYYGRTIEDVKMGSVTVSNDIQAKALDDGDTLKYTRVPRVHQLSSVSEGNTLQILNFDLATILANPQLMTTVVINPSVSTRNDYQIKLSDAAMNWLKRAFDALKAYTDTVQVTAGSAQTLGATPSQVIVNVTSRTSTNSNQLEINVVIGLDTDVTLSTDSNNVIPSQHAVKLYVDNVLLGLSLKADQVDLLALENRVNIMQGSAAPSATLKANDSDLQALASLVAGKLSKVTNDTANGVITFVQSPIVPLPTTGLQAANKDYVDNRLLNYYTKAEVDALLDIERSRIASLEVTVNNLVNTIANFPSNYYTKPQVDTLLSTKSDVTHTHTGVYHPFVAGAYTGDVTLKQLSQAQVTQGIVTWLVS